MDVFKKHYETFTILGGMAMGLVGMCMWINGQFRDIDQRFSSIDQRFSNLEKDIAVIKTVLIMKGIMPNELAVIEEKL